MGFNQETMAGPDCFPLRLSPCTPAARHPHPFILTGRCSQTRKFRRFHWQSIHTWNNKCPRLQSITPTSQHTQTHTQTHRQHTHTQTEQRRAERNGGGDAQQDEKRKKQKNRGSAGLPGSQLLPGCWLLLAMSCNCQFILSQAFHHHMQPGWRKPPESLRNLLATSHQQGLPRCGGGQKMCVWRAAADERVPLTLRWF